jgi:hypothetical protein
LRAIQNLEITLPLLMVLTGTLLMMDRFDMIRISHLAQLWPIGLIALGLQELYVWTVSGR